MGTLGHRHFAHMLESCRTTGNAGRCMRKAKDNALLSVPATLVEVGSTTFFTGSDISIDVTSTSMPSMGIGRQAESLDLNLT